MLPVGGFKQRSDKFKFYKDLTQSHNESSDKGYVPEINAEYLRNRKKHTVIYHSYQSEYW